jgi:hypothetical protein
VLAAGTGLVSRLPLIYPPAARVTASIEQPIAAAARLVGTEVPTAAAGRGGSRRFVHQIDRGQSTRIGHPPICWAKFEALAGRSPPCNPNPEGIGGLSPVFASQQDKRGGRNAQHVVPCSRVTCFGQLRGDGRGAGRETTKRAGRTAGQRIDQFPAEPFGRRITPPANVDPGMKKSPPPSGDTMPVVPPPGTPGGNPSVKPK